MKAEKKNRLYVLEHVNPTVKSVLIWAHTKQQALAFYTANAITCDLASQAAIVAQVTSGSLILNANEHAPDPTLAAQLPMPGLDSVAAADAKPL